MSARHTFCIEGEVVVRRVSEIRLCETEIAVRPPRFRIAWIMVVVFAVALNLAALVTVIAHTGLTNELLAVGAMPMASALAIGLWIGYRGHCSCAGLGGFQSFGALALAFYVVLASCIPDKTIGPYLRLFMRPLRES